MVVIYCYCVADILHKGHIEHLKNCKALGDKLIVGVLTEKAVLEKKDTPIMSFDERVDLVRALGFVDVVVPQRTYSPFENVNNIRPNILVESESHDKVEIFEAISKLDNVRLMILPYYPDYSSAAIKNKIKEEKK